MRYITLTEIPAGIYQRIDGTVYWRHEDGRWQYLSPLFGEWLDVFDQPNNGQLEKYPRNLGKTLP